MDDKKPPAVDQALVDWLTRVFPDRLPVSLGFDVQEIAYAVGQQSVIAHLRHQAKEQSQTVL
jgi:hypothetical protein